MGFGSLIQTKIRVLTVTGRSLEQRMWGMVLSYQAVTTTRIPHYVFVSSNKGVKEWCYLFRLAPNTILTCNKSLQQQRKS